MRLLITLALVALAAAPAAAQKDRAQFGEALGGTVIRGSTGATTEAEIRIERVEKKLKVIRPPGEPRKLTPAIGGALGFLVRWGGGASTTPNPARFDRTLVVESPRTSRIWAIEKVRLDLPLAGLSEVGAPVGLAVAVRVREAALTLPGNERYRGGLLLRMVLTEKGWAVMKVVLD